MQKDQSDLEREIAMMPLRETSGEFDQRVLETIAQASPASSVESLSNDKVHSSQGRLSRMVGYAVAATVLVATSYTLGFQAGIATEKESFSLVNRTSVGTPDPKPMTTVLEEIIVPAETHVEPSLALQDLLTSKQDFETIWGSKKALARLEAKVIYPSESKEGM